MHTLIAILLVVTTHLGLGVTGGTDGIGMDIETRVGDYVGIRAGFGYMPRFETTATFRAQIGNGTESETIQDERFQKMSDMLQDLMGVEVRREVKMVGTANWWNGRILVDVYPFKKKNWFFTAGIYAGASEVIRAANQTADAASLLAMQTYNNLYEKVKDEENPQPIFEYNGEKIYLNDKLAEKVRTYGKMSMPIGTRQDGTTYRMVPDEKGMVRTTVKVNAVRPYVGFGYITPISKDQKTMFRFNAGILCWGNPKLYTHDGTELTELEDINKQIEKYVRTIERMKVFPMINIQFSRYIF